MNTNGNNQTLFLLTVNRKTRTKIQWQGCLQKTERICDWAIAFHLWRQQSKPRTSGRPSISIHTDFARVDDNDIFQNSDTLEPEFTEQKQKLLNPTLYKRSKFDTAAGQRKNTNSSMVLWKKTRRTSFWPKYSRRRTHLLYCSSLRMVGVWVVTKVKKECTKRGKKSDRRSCERCCASAQQVAQKRTAKTMRAWQ